MATISDIDADAAVRKFLERDVVVNREDEAADSTDEVKSILESVAVSFLLYPQAALAFVLLAKNYVQQVLAADISVIDFLHKAVDDVDNPDSVITDTSDLIEAQTALVEVDRLGRLGSEVRAYERYTSAIDRFLNWRLARALKRRRKKEFERSGTEAKQDIFNALPVFGSIHGLVAGYLELISASVGNFESVDLTRIVSTKTVARVRSSLRRVLRGIQNRSLSNTSAAIELMAGAAALESISATRKVYDPAIKTGELPLNRTIKISSEATVAKAESLAGPFDLTGISPVWTIDLTVDPQIDGGTSYTVHLPCAGAVGRVWVLAKTGAATYNIPAGATLYVQFDGPTPPVGSLTTIKAVVLPTGTAVLPSAIVTALNHVSTGLIHGTAVSLSASGRILIYGAANVTKITVRALVPGTFSGTTYVPAAASGHALLGFVDDQTNGEVNKFTAADIADILGAWVPTATFEDTAKFYDGANGTLRISSNSSALLSSLRFSGEVASRMGFATTDYEAEPAYLELTEGGAVIDPASVGVYVGSLMTVTDADPVSGRNLTGQVTSVDGTHLLFSTRLPRCSQAVVTSIAPIVFAVQKLLTEVKPYLPSFDNDDLDLQRVMNPLISRPTLAQMNDAKRLLLSLRARLSDLRSSLAEIVVRDDQFQYVSAARHIVSALQERGLDRALELLEHGQFAEFFELSSEAASKGSRFLNALEQVGRNDFTATTIEADMKDLEPTATTPDDDLLRGEELSDNTRVQ